MTEVSPAGIKLHPGVHEATVYYGATTLDTKQSELKASVDFIHPETFLEVWKMALRVKAKFRF